MLKKTDSLYLSVVVPIFRSKQMLLRLHNRLGVALKKLNKSYEIIYVDDGSPDSSWLVLQEIYKKDKKVKAIRLTQNFGQHNALMCGFASAKGKYILTIDDDLQNPPEEIPKLVIKIEEGFDLVYGEYGYKKHSFFRNFGSSLIQTVYKHIFDVSGNLTSFRIIKRKIVKNLLKYNRNYTFIDGLLAWQTKNIGYVKVKHDQRLSGQSGYTFAKLILLSLNMLTNFSIFPLQLASIVGFLLSIVGLIFAIFVIIKKIFFGIPVTGFASIIVSITIFSGVQLITIGLIGEYIGRIHLNINQKPQYVISQKLAREDD